MKTSTVLCHMLSFTSIDRQGDRSLESFSRVETQKSSMIDKDPTAKETTPFTSMHVFSAVDIITSAGLACSRRRETSHGNDQTLIAK